MIVTQSSSAGGIARLHIDLKHLLTFVDALGEDDAWDISTSLDDSTVWYLDQGNDTPRIRALSP